MNDQTPDSEYRERLRNDAAAGNVIAERLLLLSSLMHDDLDEIEAVLTRCKDVSHKRFLEAELR